MSKQDAYSYFQSILFVTVIMSGLTNSMATAANLCLLDHSQIGSDSDYEKLNISALWPSDQIELGVDEVDQHFHGYYASLNQSLVVKIRSNNHWLINNPFIAPQAKKYILYHNLKINCP